MLNCLNLKPVSNGILFLGKEVQGDTIRKVDIEQGLKFLKLHLVYSFTKSTAAYLWSVVVLEDQMEDRHFLVLASCSCGPALHNTFASSPISHPSSISCRPVTSCQDRLILISRFTMASRRCFRRNLFQTTLISFFVFMIFFNTCKHVRHYFPKTLYYRYLEAQIDILRNEQGGRLATKDFKERFF